MKITKRDKYIRSLVILHKTTWFFLFFVTINYLSWFGKMYSMFTITYEWIWLDILLSKKSVAWVKTITDERKIMVIFLFFFLPTLKFVLFVSRRQVLLNTDYSAKFIYFFFPRDLRYLSTTDLDNDRSKKFRCSPLAHFFTSPPFTVPLFFRHISAGTIIHFVTAEGQ